MGNLCCCPGENNDNQAYLISKKTCPYCIHIFESEKEKEKHIKNCLYNKGENSYIDPSFKANNIYSTDHYCRDL